MSSSETRPAAQHVFGNSGGARRDRTDDLMLAKHALSQLSYGPRENLSSYPDPNRRRREANGRRAGLRVRRTAHEPYQRPRSRKHGGPGRTRTSDLTLIKRAL